MRLFRTVLPTASKLMDFPSIKSVTVSKIALNLACALITIFGAGSRDVVAATTNPDAGARLFPPEADWPAGRDASPAFTPDGGTVFFTHGDGDARTIMISRRRDGHWSAPQPASFSGVWRDIEPYMAPDGSYLVFISNRPATPGGTPLDGYFSGKIQSRAGGAIWRVDRKGDEWGEAVRLPDIINSNSSIYSPALTSDGSVYFNQPDPVTRTSHIYRAQARAAGFDEPMALAISDPTTSEYDAAVAPDDSFMVFSSARPPAKPGQSLMFIAFRCHGAWSDPKPIEPSVRGIEARFSPDMKTLYFQAEMTTTSGVAIGAPSARIFEMPFRS